MRPKTYLEEFLELSLKTLKIRDEYRSDSCNLIQDFYVPCLEESVETVMEPYIGKEYVLVFNSAKPDCQPESIVLNGDAYPLVRQSPNEFEWTEIVEVSRNR